MDSSSSPPDLVDQEHSRGEETVESIGEKKKNPQPQGKRRYRLYYQKLSLLNPTDAKLKHNT